MTVFDILNRALAGENISTEDARLASLWLDMKEKQEKVS